MRANEADRLVVYLADASDITSTAEITRWTHRVYAFLSEVAGVDAADRFRALGSHEDNSYDELAMKRGHVEGLIAKNESVPSLRDVGSLEQVAVEERQIAAATRKIFVVHGHDNEVKESVARFLEKLELQPIILHEQPNQGRTVIEKFEVLSSDVAFAIVLLTPDDLGCAANVPKELRTRARQNVILELGYFLGRLGVRESALFIGEALSFPPTFRESFTLSSIPLEHGRRSLHRNLLKPSSLSRLRAY